MTLIRVRGARQHNLKGVDLDLDLSQITVLCGRSGSGKSSFAFDTLHAEGQRRYIEALSVRARHALPQLPRPDCDLVEGVPPTIALEQRFEAPAGRSTVGTFTDADAVLRILFGRTGVQHDPATGEPIRPVTHDVIVAAILALPEGTRLHIEAPVRAGPGVLQEVARAGFSRVRVDGAVRALDELRPQDVRGAVRVVVDRIRLSADRKDRLYDTVRTATNAGRGIVVVVADERELTFVDRPYSVALDRLLPALQPSRFRLRGSDPCAACEGAGLVEGAVCGDCAGTGVGEATRAVRVDGWTWPDVQQATVDTLAAATWTRTPVTAPLVEELERRLAAVRAVGLGGLPLGRPLNGLSSGELQRVRLARQVGARLSGVLYVLDEPTAGLGDDEARAVIGLMHELRRQGNGVIVVEHHPLVIAAADRVVEFGPGPGLEGGRVVYDGSPALLSGADTPTGRWLRAGHGPPALSPVRWGSGDGGPEGTIALRGGRARRCVDLYADLIPGAINLVSGPSASGKSALLDAIAAHVQARIDRADSPPGRLVGAERFERLVVAEAEAASRGRRSMPATYVGFWETMRELLAATQEAKVRGLEAAAFSLNLKGGRCEACKGQGVDHVDLGFLPEVSVPCEVCEGRRFARDVLEVRYRGLSAGELLDLTADQAHPLLAGHPRLDESLRALREVGLGYLRLGQPTESLSGGEAQRLKLARELVRAMRLGGAATLFLLDEPFVGLHPDDTEVLLRLLRRLVETGGTVVVATRLWGTSDASRQGG